MSCVKVKGWGGMEEQKYIKGARVSTDIDDIDDDWVYLLLQAKKMGITVQEIKEFFRKAAKVVEDTSMI